jgi:hypothetical protein
MNGMSPPDSPAIHTKKSDKTVTGNATTSRAAQTGSGIIPMKYRTDAITQTPAPAQKIRAAVVLFIFVTPA